MTLLHFTGYLGALTIGILLGLVGGGGSLLAVPVLVVLFSVGSETATHEALFVVGLTSLVGVAEHLRQKMVHWPTVFWFGLPSLLSVWFTRHWLLPRVPPLLLDTPLLTLTKDRLILLLFTLVMLAAALAMIRPVSGAAGVAKNSDAPAAFWLLPVQGAAVGTLTGWVGAGGGFLIVPGLVVLARLPLPTAVGTSLVLVSLNSAIGFLSNPPAGLAVDYGFLLFFSALSILGILLSTRFARRLPSERLRPAFGYVLLLVGVGMLFYEFG